MKTANNVVVMALVIVIYTGQTTGNITETKPLTGTSASTPTASTPTTSNTTSTSTMTTPPPAVTTTEASNTTTTTPPSATTTEVSNTTTTTPPSATTGASSTATPTALLTGSSTTITPPATTQKQYGYPGIEAVAGVSVAAIVAIAVAIAICTAYLEQDKSKLSNEKRKSKRLMEANLKRQSNPYRNLTNTGDEPTPKIP